MGITATQTQRENKATWTSSGVTEHCEGPGGDLIELPCPNLKGVTSPYMLHREKPVQPLWKPIWHLARLELHTLQPSHSTPRHSSPKRNSCAGTTGDGATSFATACCHSWRMDTL